MKHNLAVEPGSTKKNKTGSWGTYYAHIDKEKCIGCATCRQVCPDCICGPTGEVNSRGRKVFQNDLDYCKGCGLCAQECPAKAISMILK